MTLESAFVVTEAAMRPASLVLACFYCHQGIGDKHLTTCVLVKRRVTVRTIIEHVIEVPAHWDAEMVEFHRNESSWCADNFIGELQELAQSQGCICANTTVVFVRDESPAYLGEK